MGGNHIVLSVTAPQYTTPSAVLLHSLCKHAPLQSITTSWAQPSPRQARQLGQQKATADVRHQQQRQQLGFKPLQHRQQPSWSARHRVKQAQPTAFLDSDSCTEDLRQCVQYLNPAGTCRTSSTGVSTPASSISSSEQLSSLQLPQWQVVRCSVQNLQIAAQLTITTSSAGGLAEDASAAPSTQLPANALNSQHVQGPRGQDKARPAAQPAALNDLMLAAKHKQPVTAAGLKQTLHQVQQLMPQLPLYQLAYAAWAAAELSHQQAPTQGWLQQLLDSAQQHFQQPGSVTDETAVATLLQALVRLELLPSQDWLAGCCVSLVIDQWRSPRALSTLAACLPQLGYVPDEDFCSKFYEASAGTLPASPGISAARMLHGVVAWRHLNQAEQQHTAAPPEHWLLLVLQQLCIHSSQLKPAEIAMVLQAMQRLQQQQQQQAAGSQQQDPGQLLPAPGQQPVTLLQQCSQQLLQALMAAVLQQLLKFKAQDMTVMFLAVASLAQQQQTRVQDQLHQPSVRWSWLQRVLTAVQLQQLDPRGQATCLTAAAMLIKPHLQLQQLHKQHKQQQQQQQQQVGFVQQEQQGAGMVKPLQRWIQLQQQQQQLKSDTGQLAESCPAPAAEAAATCQQQLTSRAMLQGDLLQDVGSYWRQWLNSFFQQSHGQLLSFSCEDLTVSLCALASSKQVPPVGWYEAMLSAVQEQVPFMTAGQAAGIAWALGTMALLPSQHDGSFSLVPAESWMLRLYPAAGNDQGTTTATRVASGAAGSTTVTFDMRSCSAPELVNLMWSAAVCDCDPGNDWWAAAENQLVELAADTRHSQCADAAAAVAGTGNAGPQQQQSLQLLCLLAQAYAARSCVMPTTVLQQLFLSPAVLLQLLLPAPVSSITALLKALRQCQCMLPSTWLQQLAVGLQQRLLLLEPQELLQLLDSLSGAGLRLLLNQEARQLGQQKNASSWQGLNSSSWASVCMSVTQQRMQQLSASDVSFLMWILVKLQVKPPASWVESALQRLQTGFLDAKPSSLGLAITALSKLGYMPPADWMSGFMMASHRKAAAMAADPDSNKLMLARFILMTLWALADLKVQPLNPKWVKAMLVTVHQQLPLLQAQQSLALLQVLARLRCRPSPRFLQNLLDHMGDCSRCDSSDLVRMVYAAASLRWQPNRSWCQMFLAASGPKLAEMDCHGLALVHWSLAVMRLTPAEAWKTLATTAVMTRLDKLNSADLSMIVWSWGKMMVHLTPRQEVSRAQQRQQRKQWKQQIQQLYVEQQQWQGGVRQPGWQQQWLQQQWQEWREQKQQQQQLNPHPQRVASLADLSLLRQRMPGASKLLEAASSLQGTYNLPSLVYLLVGVAKLQLRPSQEWLQAMALHGSTEKLSVLNGLQLQQLLWALAKLGYRAQQQWLATVSVLLEVSWQENDYIRHSAAAAFARLQRLALPGIEPSGQDS